MLILLILILFSIYFYCQSCRTEKFNGSDGGYDGQTNEGEQYGSAFGPIGPDWYLNELFDYRYIYPTYPLLPYYFNRYWPNNYPNY